MKKPPKGIGLYLVKLKSGEQKYQSRLWNPILARIGKKHTWQDKDLSVVIRKHLDLKQAYEAGGYEIIKERPEPAKKHPELLLQCAGMYEAYLRDDPKLVPAHKAKGRSKKYIANTIEYLKTFLQVLKDAGYRLSHTHISALDDQAVALFYQHLETRYKAGEIGEVTYNRHISACKYWLKTLIDEFDYNIKNSFDGISTKTISTDPQFLELQELEQILAAITPENAWGTKGKTKVERVSYYREWLQAYLLVSAFIGARPNEIAELRWSNVDGNYIIITNSKISKQKKDRNARSYVYIHPDLARILASLRSRSDSDEDYILVPDHENRDHLQSFVSKAFNHFLMVSGVKKEVSLYNLRHTYVNALYNLIGEEGLSVHHKKETAVKHYLSKKKKLELQDGKRLFNLDISQYIY